MGGKGEIGAKRCCDWDVWWAWRHMAKLNERHGAKREELRNWELGLRALGEAAMAEQQRYAAVASHQ
jgi:hypothetical protein